MSNPTTRRFTSVLHKPWFKRTLLGLGIFLLLFGLFAYFALPGIIKSQAEKQVGEKLHRQLGIERIEINPLTLALDIHGVKMLEPDGKALFIAFDHLHLNVSLQSLFRLAPVVKEVRLEKPYVHLVRTAANHYSIDDIIALGAAGPPSDQPARFAIYNIQVEDGRVEFEDQPAHAKHVVSDFRLGVPFVSSLPSQVDVFVEPLLGAKINDSPLLLKGKMRTFAATKEATLDINLDAVDLTRYMGYLPFKPQFSLPSAGLDVHLTTVFRQAKDESPQLVLKGSTSLKSVLVTEPNGKPLLKLPLIAVTLDDLNVLSSRFAISRVEIDQPEVAVVKNADGSFNLARLSPPPERRKIREGKIAAAKEAGLQLALGELVIRGAHLDYSDVLSAFPLRRSIDKLDLKISKTEVDLQKQNVSIAAVTSSAMDFVVVRDKTAEGRTAGPTVAANSAATDKEAKGYRFSVNRVAIDNWSARWEDHSLPHTAVTTASAIALDVQDLSNLPGKRGKLELKAQINQKGRIDVAGAIGLSPLHADLALDLKAVDLMPLQPWFAQQVNLQMTSVALTSRASLKIDQADDGVLKGTFDGDIAANDLATVDKLSSDDFLRWKTLAFDGVNVQLAPLAVNIRQITLDDFFARVIVNANGRINLQDIVRKEGEERTSLTAANNAPADKATGPAPPTAPPAATTTTEKPAAMPPVKIRKVVLKRGTVLFSDNFIKPNYTANLKDLVGTVSNLSSDAAATADVDLHGKVNSAPLNILGRVNPLSGNLFFDLKADVKGMELAPLKAYSDRYVGYDIEKGTLSFDVAYHLENRKLEAKNRLVLDQLTFGNKVESPSATTLPVRFAVSLLQDRNGVIDIELPISGSLDDPQFSVGGIIVRVIVNLITKAVTEPFALLGSLFGGGTEMSSLEFDSGQSAITAAGETRLTSLAKALNDRPALKLDITGRYDPQTDRDGLRQTGIERKVRALKLKQMTDKGQSADVNTLVVSREEYPILLAKVYKDEDFPKPRNLVGMQKDLPLEEMEKLMMENAKVSDDELVALGNRRAQAAKDWLVYTGQVPAERVFVIAGKRGEGGDKARASRVDFSLH